MRLAAPDRHWRSGVAAGHATLLDCRHSGAESPCRAFPFTWQVSLQGVIRTDRNEFRHGKIAGQGSRCRRRNHCAGTGITGRRHRRRLRSRLRTARPPLRAEHGIGRDPQPRNASRVRRMGSEPHVLIGQTGTGASAQARRRTAHHTPRGPQARSSVRPWLGRPRRSSHAADGEREQPRPARGAANRSGRSEKVGPPSSDTRSAPHPGSVLNVAGRFGAKLWARSPPEYGCDGWDAVDRRHGPSLATEPGAQPVARPPSSDLHSGNGPRFTHGAHAER